MMATTGKLAQIENSLHGWPDEALTLGLLLVALVLVLAALTAPTMAKAAILAWAVLP